MKKIIVSMAIMLSVLFAIDFNAPTCFLSNKTVLLSGEPFSGEITVVNNTDKVRNSHIIIYFIKDNIIQNSTKSYAYYSVPAFTENTYKVENGPSIIVDKDSTISLVIENGKSKITKQILVLSKLYIK